MNWIKSSLTLLISVSLSLGILEIGVRLIYNDVGLFNRYHATVKYDEFLTRRLAPNISFTHTSKDGIFTYKTNSSGFRMNHDIPKEKPQNRIRVLILGDSHTQGFEVQGDQTFGSLLDAKRCNSKTLEVINTGISGSGTSEHLIALKYFLKKYNPDIVIEAFYPNDFQNNRNAFHYILNGALAVKTKQHPAYNGLKILEFHNSFALARFLSENSYAYSLFMNFSWQKGREFFYSLENEELARNSDLLELANEPNETKSDVTLFNLILDEMYSTTSIHGAKFKIIGIPSIKHYEIQKYLSSSNKKSLIDISFDPGQPWHVQNGYRHINPQAHEKIAREIHAYLCHPKKIH